MRSFCGECGSSLYATTARNDKIVSVFAGTLDNVSEWQPSKEQYCKNKAEWVAIAPEAEFKRHVADPFSPTI